MPCRHSLIHSKSSGSSEGWHTITANFGTTGSASARTLAVNNRAIFLDAFSYGLQPFWV
jgi:hypothetical protein